MCLCAVAVCHCVRGPVLARSGVSLAALALPIHRVALMPLFDGSVPLRGCARADSLVRRAGCSRPFDASPHTLSLWRSTRRPHASAPWRHASLEPFHAPLLCLCLVAARHYGCAIWRASSCWLARELCLPLSLHPFNALSSRFCLMAVCYCGACSCCLALSSSRLCLVAVCCCGACS